MEALYAVVPGEYSLRLEKEQLDLATLRPADLVIEAETTVVSAGTELAIYSGVAPGVHTPGSWNAYPFRPGYGLVGRVIAAGSEVKRNRRGERIFCFGKHASHQFYDVSEETPRNAAFALDADLPAATAVMLRMALIAQAAPALSTFEAGDVVCVFGLGLVGNLAAQLYRLGGATVVGLDPIRARCDLARRVGVETVIDVSPENQVATVKDVVGSAGVAIAIDAVGHSAVIENCVDVCAPFGQVILLGSPRAPYSMNVTNIMRAIHTRWLTLRGALEWRLPPYPVPGSRHSIKSTLDRLVYLVRTGQLHLNELVTHRIRPEELSTAYRGLHRAPEHYVGVVVEWGS